MANRQDSSGLCRPGGGRPAPGPAYFDGEVPDDEERIQVAERRHLLPQRHHLRTYPCVTRRLVSRRLRVHTWYHTGTAGRMLYWDAGHRAFRER